MILLTTIRQSGTNYMMNKLGRENIVQKHCHPYLLFDMEGYDEVAMTYRDPFLVGAAWANRYDWKEAGAEWMVTWSAYAALLDYADQVFRVADFTGPVVKPGRDDKGAHRAYSEGNMDKYYELVPKELIDHALEMSRTVRH